MAEKLEPQFAEDEDLERAKAFWKENGNSIIAGIVLGVGAIGGYNGWQYWKKNEGENASTLYQNMQDPEIGFDAAKSLATELSQDYTNTPYAIHAALSLAKRAVEEDNLDEAVAQLKWASNTTEEKGLREIINIRLAMVHLEKGEADAVLSLVPDQSASESSEFRSRYAELRGDAYAMKQDSDAARAAYEYSLDSLSAGAQNRTLLQLKLDNL